MNARQASSNRRQRLERDLRALCQDGSLRPGDPLPSTRELQARYHLSPATVTNVLAQLAEQGLVIIVPRSGSFVADHAARPRKVFAMTIGAYDQDWVVTPFIDQIRHAFEKQIARHGGSTVVLNPTDFRTAVGTGAMPELAGVYVSTGSPDVLPEMLVPTGVPVVRTWQGVGDAPGTLDCDWLSVDNLDGGRRATQHLARQGHRVIGYLGYDPQAHSGYWAWSELRARGWREVMAELNQSTADLEFVAPSDTATSHEADAARQAAEAILPRRDITAVVCANDHAVAGLIRALQAHRVPPSGWPAMIGFDGLAEVDRHVVTSLQLPWSEMGTTAADLLFDRATARLVGPGSHHHLPMEVVPRVEIPELWSLNSGATPATR